VPCPSVASASGAATARAPGHCHALPDCRIRRGPRPPGRLLPRPGAPRHRGGRPARPRARKGRLPGGASRRLGLLAGPGLLGASRRRGAAGDAGRPGDEAWSSAGGLVLSGNPPGSGVGPRGKLRSGGDSSGGPTPKAARRVRPRPRAGRLGASRPSLRRGRERSLRRGAPGGPRKGWHQLVEGRSSPPCQGPQPSSPGPSSI
jgi:hypothetical protein